MKKLIIIAGAAGEIGTAFAKKFINNNRDVIAIVRNTDIDVEKVHKIKLNLDNRLDIEDKLKDVNLSIYDKVILLHTIGVDKFDPRGYPNIQKMDTIDKDVYDTNVNSFKYIMRYLVKRLSNTNTKLTLGMIGGVADKYTPFVIESFCEAKYIIRQYIQSQIKIHPDFISGISINVTSTITKSALKVRPYADTTFWLTPDDVVNQSFGKLLSCDDGYQEIDIIKELPNFKKNYYEDNESLYKKWSKETGIK